MAESEKGIGFLLTSFNPESTQALVILTQAGISYSPWPNDLENALPVFFPCDENRQYVGLDSIKTFVENFKKRGEKSG